MSVLGILSWLGALAAGLLVMISLAAGLYYLAELIEEYTVLTRKIIRFASYFVGLCHLGLWMIDGFPMAQSLFSLFCLGWYSLMLKNFPVIELLSPVFMGSCVLVIANHFTWFFYFTRHFYSLAEIGSFFGLLVWMVPFTYFISLSANEYTLPTDTVPTRSSSEALAMQLKRGNLIKGFVKSIVEELRPWLPTIQTSPRTGPKNF